MIGRNAVVAVGLWLPISISALPRLSYAPWNFDYGKVAFYPDGLRGCLLQGNAHRYSGNLLRDLACSADGGQHWTVVAERIAGLAELRLHSDSVHGWAVGERVVLRTEDGGRTWDRIAVDVDGWPNSAHFAKDALGGLGSWSRSLQSRRSPSALRTSDGGRNWLAVDFGITHTEVYDTYLSPDGKHAWALLNTSDFGMTPPNVVIAKSSDGGVRWVVERT